MMQEHKVYFENIDGFRTIAVLPVLIGHSLGFPTLNWTIDNNFLSFLLGIVPNAHYGVTLFFVISGFLITYLLLKEKERNGAINIKFFYIRRILRIWPLYFLVVLFGYLILPLFNIYSNLSLFNSQNIPSETWWKYLFFLANYDLISSNGTTPILTVLWSVSIEEQFYLFWPILINYFSKKNILYVFSCIIVASVVWRWKFMGSINIYYYHTISNLFELAIGALSAYIVFYYQGIRSKIENISKLTISLIYIGGCGLLYAKFSNMYIAYLKDIFVGLFFMFIILEQSFCKNSIFKLVKFKYLSSLGKYTYSLYSLHLIVLFIYVFILKIINIEGIVNSNCIAIILILGCLIFSLVISYASYHYYEKPFLTLKEKYT